MVWAYRKDGQAPASSPSSEAFQLKMEEKEEEEN